nr:MAG TPA: hypothetical protein [Caudoviricetes sp.]
MKNKQGGCMIFFIIWGVVALIIGFAFNSINKTGQSIGSIIALSLVMGALIAFVVFCFNMAILTSKAKKVVRQQQQKDKVEGISRYDSIIHIGGLNAPENCKCTVVLNSSSLVIVCGGNEFTLNIAKVRNVDFQLDIDEKQYLKSSMAGGIAGAALFGVSGAVIGAAPKTKTKREVKCYAIISYEDAQGAFRTFILRDEVPNLSRCAKLVDTLKPMIKVQVNKVEL